MYFKFYFLLIFLLLQSCQTPTESNLETTSPSVDLEQVKQALQTTLERFHQVYKAGNLAVLDSLLSPNGFYCLTEPETHFHKAEWIQFSKDMQAAGKPPINNYAIDLQKIRLAEDGKSAIVIEQMIMAHISPIPMCMTSYWIYTENTWLLDFANFAFIPPNRDLRLFNEAIADLERQKPPSPQKVDLSSEEQKIASSLHQVHQANRTAEPAPLETLLTSSGLFCGTDPGGHMDKEALIWYIKKTGTEGQPELDNYAIDIQEIRLAADGQSAIALEQMNMEHVSPMPIRMISHWIKIEGQWHLDFTSFGFIPSRNELLALNRVSREYKANTKDVKRW